MSSNTLLGSVHLLLASLKEILPNPPSINNLVQPAMVKGEGVGVTDGVGVIERDGVTDGVGVADEEGVIEGVGDKEGVGVTEAEGVLVGVLLGGGGSGAVGGSVGGSADCFTGLGDA